MTLRMNQPGPKRGKPPVGERRCLNVSVGSQAEKGKRSDAAQGIERQSSALDSYSEGLSNGRDSRFGLARPVQVHTAHY